MTEAEWLVCANPETMIGHIRLRTTDRKLRHFAVACLQAILNRLSDSRSMAAVKVLAEYSDGRASAEELHAAWRQALKVMDSLMDDPSEQSWHYVAVFAADSVALALNPESADNIGGVVARCIHALATAADVRAVRVESRRQVKLMHDIFGNPFRSVTIEPSWLTSTVVQLAEGIYQENAFDRLPILADCLQETGCESGDILNHLRSNNLHVRGCWALDLILGKE